MNKKLILGLILILVLSIFVGCSTNTGDTGSEKPVNEETVKQEPVVEENNELEVRESELGKLTVVNKNKSVGAIQEAGPFTIKVNQMQVASLETNESSKALFDDKDKLTVITLEVEVENKSTDTNMIYPDQGTIVTNTKEQKDANLFLSDNVGGDFIGEVIKKGNVIFTVNSPAEEVTSFKYIISAPFDSNFGALGEEITFELSL